MAVALRSARSEPTPEAVAAGLLDPGALVTTALNNLAADDQKQLSDNPLPTLKTWANSRRNTPEAVDRRFLARTLIALIDLADNTDVMQRVPAAAAPPALPVAVDNGPDCVEPKPKVTRPKPVVTKVEAIAPLMIGRLDISVAVRRFGWELAGPLLSLLHRALRWLVPSLQVSLLALGSGLVLHLLMHPEAAIALVFSAGALCSLVC